MRLEGDNEPLPRGRRAIVEEHVNQSALTDAKGKIVLVRKNPRSCGGFDIRQWPLLRVGFRTNDLTQQAHPYLCCTFPHCKYPHKRWDKIPKTDEALIAFCNSHSHREGPPDIRRMFAVIERPPDARPSLRQLELGVMTLLGRGHISARFCASNLLPLLKQFFEFGQANPRLETASLEFLTRDRRRVGESMGGCGDNDLELFLSHYKEVRIVALISDGVTIGHDKINLLGIINALHPELDPVVVRILHRFAGDHKSFAEMLREVVLWLMSIGLEPAGGTIDGLPVQVLAWNQAGKRFALKGIPGVEGFVTLLCAPHTWRRALHDSAGDSEAIDEMVGSLRRGAKLLTAARLRSILGVVARHGSETRFGDDQQEMSFLVDHLAVLRAFAESVQASIRAGRKILTTEELKTLIAMISSLPKYVSLISPRIDGLTALEANSASIGDVLSVVRGAQDAAMQLTSELGRVYPELESHDLLVLNRR